MERKREVCAVCNRGCIGIILGEQVGVCIVAGACGEGALKNIRFRLASAVEHAHVDPALRGCVGVAFVFFAFLRLEDPGRSSEAG